MSFNPHPRLGQKVICPHCDVELEVISVDPLELDWAYDWSEDELDGWEDE
jgi:lysine biosynthesis protein LysW